MQQELGPVGRILHEKLRVALHPTRLEVIDESSQHHGHAGAHPMGESHFRLRIASPHFAGLSLVAKHRKINEIVAQELKTKIHALAIEIMW